MTAKNKQNPSPGSYRIPVALRVGGAFMALAIVLLVFTVVSVFLDGWMVPFVVTPSFLVILLAAVIFGAFATVRKDQAASRSQVIALIVAVALVILSRFLPATALYVMAQYWLPMYAVLAFLCGLVIRRSLIPKG
ncbi:hypothetical protein [Corynebacterium halotolerans]|uniref:Uncharacterized protein n=1 Tax=Corynebacterium halotolerans YIM 70093 = DSM 44683 TaxID=1121362 RepID=M1NSS6_9CORY|nr:hypothetical protein [Corynebacterium halotolerans]AGF72492.1 hypothetical protein A605_07450 [Corynebacterium halotolerans YIM 70093 = DSM 44683]